MVELPPALASFYRLATASEVRSWSFGLLKFPRKHPVTSWQDQRGTLNDQAIFGPTTIDECACGKYSGPQYRRMICDRRGVRVTSPSVRRERFGHIEFGQELRHPLGNDVDSLSAFPVLPAALIESPGGQALGRSL